MFSSFLVLVKILTLVLLPFAAVQAQDIDIGTQCQITAFEIFLSPSSTTTILQAPLHFFDLAIVSATLAEPVVDSQLYAFLLTFFNATAVSQYSVTITDTAFSFSGSTPAARVPITGNQFNSPNSLLVSINVNSIVYLPVQSNRTCSYNYEITMIPAAILGDPQFVGLRGQSYQIHGIDGAIYNLISTHEYAINSRFEFLTGPRHCPIMPSTGKKTIACWSHDGSYLANLAIVTSQGEKFAAMSGQGDKGFAQVVFNNQELKVGDNVKFSQGSIFFNTTHELTIEVGVFHIEVENIDGFVNLRRVHVDQSRWMELEEHDGTHGLLGQTWQNKRYKGQKIPEIEGDVDDYVIADNDLYGSDFIFNRLASQ